LLALSLRPQAKVRFGCSKSIQIHAWRKAAAIMENAESIP
jgi:hypothetical protein